MARLNIYMPDELAKQAKEAGLHVSAMAQDAIRKALGDNSTDVWLASLQPVAPATSHDLVIEAVDAVRDEPTTYHGRSDG
jgi:post-segregation antitoxin (ccd killing protein)